jgi:hypothetical protein
MAKGALQRPSSGLVLPVLVLAPAPPLAPALLALVFPALVLACGALLAFAAPGFGRTAPPAFTALVCGRAEPPAFTALAPDFFADFFDDISAAAFFAFAPDAFAAPFDPPAPDFFVAASAAPLAFAALAPDFFADFFDDISAAAFFAFAPDAFAAPFDPPAPDAAFARVAPDGFFGGFCPQSGRTFPACRRTFPHRAIPAPRRPRGQRKSLPARVKTAGTKKMGPATGRPWIHSGTFGDSTGRVP